ncbi:MAG: enoyl-CoA hydratase/isomerase family protein [Chloroflexota bacterium]
MALVEYVVKNKIAYITLNRPEKRNAINLQMKDDIVACMRRYDEDKSAWVAIVSGNGPAFCTGIDLTELAIENAAEVDRLYLDILRVKKPLICLLHGFALAQGDGIAFCCDIRIAAEGCQFGWPQAKRGISSISGPSFAAHHLPLGYAYEFLFTGNFFDSNEAYRLNMVNRVVPQDKLMAAGEELASQILECAPKAVQTMKEAVQRGMQMPLAERMHTAGVLLSENLKSHDAQEGLKAFAEKRKPNYTGE